MGYMQYMAHATDRAGARELSHLGWSPEEAVANARDGINAHLLTKNAPQAHTVALGRAQGGE